jgi:hypothetical protein
MSIPEPEIRRSARLGRLSLGFGLLSLLLLFVLAFALYAANKITFDHVLKNGLAFLLTSQFFIGGPLLHLTGLCLGIVALFRRSQKKLAAAFGVALNLLLPAIGVILTVFWVLLSAIPPVR